MADVMHPSIFDVSDEQYQEAVRRRLQAEKDHDLLLQQRIDNLGKKTAEEKKAEEDRLNNLSLLGRVIVRLFVNDKKKIADEEKLLNDYLDEIDRVFANLPSFHNYNFNKYKTALRVELKDFEGTGYDKFRHVDRVLFALQQLELSLSTKAFPDTVANYNRFMQVATDSNINPKAKRCAIVIGIILFAAALIAAALISGGVAATVGLAMAIKLGLCLEIMPTGFALLADSLGGRPHYAAIQLSTKTGEEYADRFYKSLKVLSQQRLGPDLPPSPSQLVHVTR